MSNTPLMPDSNEERKRKENEAFQAFFAKERQQEESRNKTALVWIIIFGVGVPAVIGVIYFVFVMILAIIGA